MHSRRKHLDQSKRSDKLEWPREDCHIVRAQGSRGDNLVAVDYTNGSTALVLLPARFRKKIWVKKGSYLIVEQSQKQDTVGRNRILGSIEIILSQEDVKDLQQRNLWPPEFEEDPTPSIDILPASRASPDKSGSGSESDDGLMPLQPNNNRPSIVYDFSEDDSSSN